MARASYLVGCPVSTEGWPSSLALAEQVDRATSVDEFHRPAADHADAALWPLPLRKDGPAGREELDLGPGSRAAPAQPRRAR